MEQASVRLQLTATAPTAACPRCAVSSSSIHSRYQRHLTDLPWRTHAVHLQLTVRKFFCRNPSCARRIFTERLPALVTAYARKTSQLVTALRAIGVALGGNAGARLAARLRLPTSPATVLRLVRIFGDQISGWRQGGAPNERCRPQVQAPQECPQLLMALAILVSSPTRLPRPTSRSCAVSSAPYGFKITAVVSAAWLHRCLPRRCRALTPA
jgi:hypothetical protein